MERRRMKLLLIIAIAFGAITGAIAASVDLFDVATTTGRYAAHAKACSLKIGTEVVSTTAMFVSMKYSDAEAQRFVKTAELADSTVTSCDYDSLKQWGDRYSKAFDALMGGAKRQ
jgi:hypothetical protein